MTVSRGSAHALFLSMLRTQGLLLTSRQQLPRAHAEVDSAAYPMLFALTRGPLRVSDLATTTRGELSTVSRQVTALARLGLVRKDADPGDGRVQLVALTDAGTELLQGVTDLRATWLQELLADWPEDEVQAATSRFRAVGDLLEAWLVSRGAALPPGPAEIEPS